MIKDMQDFIEVKRYAFMAVPTLVIVLEDKGGVGKSLIAQIIGTLLSFDPKETVQMVDTDYSNSTTAQVHADTKMLDLRKGVAIGILTNVVQKIADKIVKHAVIDVGAREETDVIKHLSHLVDMMTAIGGRVVVVRPITLGSHNQRNAVRFMDKAEELGIPVVFVRNEGQGRLPEYFERWLQLESREDALKRGAVETFLQDGDVRYADEAVGFSITIADIALRDFSKVKQADMQEARSIFDDDVCAFLNIWLRQSMRNFGDAIEEAIEKRARLNIKDSARMAGISQPSNTKAHPRKGG